MNIDIIKCGIVIDHIQKGRAMQLYSMLGLDALDCPVAVIKNVPSKKTGKKDIIKIDEDIALSLDVVGYVSPNATINFIRDGKIVEKKHIDTPKTLTNIIKCKNPRCITTTEQDIEHIFKLMPDGAYRCIYCDTKAAE